MKNSGIKWMVCGMVCLASSAYAGEPVPQNSEPSQKQIKVLCSTFPVYLFTKNIVAGSDTMQVGLMLPAALGCPHDYMVTPQDLQRLTEAQVLIINGLGMESFLEKSLRKADSHLIVIDSSQGITDLIQLGEDAEDSDSIDSHEHHHTGVNPHLFASPRLAAQITQNIAAEISKIDPAHQDLYQKNAKQYAEKLNRLAEEFQSAARSFRSVKIVTEHAVFDYLARDCGLEVAAIVEESPGQEPAADQMLQLVRIIRESKAAALFTEPQYPAKIGQTLARETGIPVAVLDPVAGGPDNAPADYYEIVMRHNLETLKKTLAR